MTIEGYFDSSGEPAPYVEARVHLPRLGLSGTVDFLLDTGADATTLHPGDTGKIPIDLNTLSQDSISVRGIGGEMRWCRKKRSFTSRMATRAGGIGSASMCMSLPRVNMAL